MSACTFVSSAVNEEISSEAKAGVKEDLGVVYSSLQYINDLLRSLLDMHKASSDQLKIEMKPACLRKDILEPVATMLHKRDYGFRVEIDCPDDLMVTTDPIRLKQIVLNLSNNSCKFVDKGYLRIGGKVATEENGGNAFVFVEDSGPGVPEEKRDTLFQKFQSSLDSLSQGTGVGLSLCKDLARLMGGDISLDDSFESGVEDRPGTRFVIDLNSKPLELQDFSGAEGGVDDDNPLSCRKATLPDLPTEFKILFVDDDLVLRKLFARSIKRVAPTWEIQEAVNGEMAVHVIEEGKTQFDLIFLDQYMASVQKQMLGTETARALRSIGYKGIICGLSANSVQEAFILAGADNFITKPFPAEKEALTRALYRVIYPDLDLAIE